MAELMDNAKKVVLAAREHEDGTWRAVMLITYNDDRTPYMGEHPQPFDSSDAVVEWQNTTVLPLLELANPSMDSNRPKGANCTYFEYVNGERVYCGEPALYHLPFPNSPFPDEYCCEKHQQKLQEDASPLLKAAVRRIN
jgi:hypothetical protein